MHVVTSPLTVVVLNGGLAYLARNGFDVTVVSAPGELLDKISAANGVTAIPLPMEREIAPLRDALALVRAYRLLRRLRPHVLNYGTPKASLLFAIAGRLSGVPCRVHTVHGFRSETTSGLRHVLLRWAERIACRSAHTVICVSHSLRRKAIELGYADELHSRVLAGGSSSGVESSQFAPTEDLRERAAAVRNQWKIPPEAPVIGFVGRLVRDKGIAELVEAFSRLRTASPELRLLLVGGKEEGDPLSADLWHRIGNDPYIICPGQVPDARSYYHAMSVFALPTYREGFPNVVLEAQAARLPVVTTTATGAIDSIVDGVTGILVPPRDPDALATALGRLLADPNLRACMGAAGSKYVSENFRPQDIFEALAGTYRELLLKQCGPAHS